MQAMSELSEMTCEEFSNVAAELALGVLTGRERARALAHLDRCDACRDEVRQLTQTGEELLGLLPTAEPPAGFESRVLARIGIEPPAKKSRRWKLGRWSAARPAGVTRRMLATAAVVAAIAVGGGGGGGGGAGVGSRWRGHLRPCGGAQPRLAEYQLNMT
jgi:anti-sigma-K factor RskA